MMLMSSEMATSAPGLCTFTATSDVVPSPFFSMPRYTCPSDADAMGRSLSVSLPAIFGPSSAARMRRARSSSKGGTESCSVRSSRMYGAGSRSWRLDSTCPSFTYVGPRLMRRSRSWTARLASTSAFFATAGSSPSILRSSHNAKAKEPRREPERMPRRMSVTGRDEKYFWIFTGSKDCSSVGSSSPSLAARAAHSSMPALGSLPPGSSRGASNIKTVMTTAAAAGLFPTAAAASEAAAASSGGTAARAADAAADTRSRTGSGSASKAAVAAPEKAS
mmetsp:Transcript_39172/g.97037  ORF Transcript_39172/g.97037 Transcript_39172/m.97037 type:complete len:277 (+) Transcript_39172:1113-1943(+)